MHQCPHPTPQVMCLCAALPQLCYARQTYQARAEFFWQTLQEKYQHCDTQRRFAAAVGLLRMNFLLSKTSASSAQLSMVLFIALIQNFKAS